MLSDRVIISLLAGLCALQFAQAMPAMGIMELFGGTNNLVCNVCKQVVNEMKSPNNIAAMEAAIKTLCRVRGTPEASKKCEDQLNDYLKQVQNSNAQQVCQAVSMCPADDEATSSEGPSEGQMKAIDLFQGLRSGDSFLCNSCKQLVGLFKENLESMRLIVDQVCEGSSSPDACKKAFNDNLDILESWSPEELCTNVLMCP